MKTARQVLWVLGAVLGICLALTLALSVLRRDPSLQTAAAAVGLVAGTLFIFINRRLQHESQVEIEQANRRSELFEREMRRQREVVDELADGLDVAIFLCDSKGAVEYANRKAIELFRFEDPRGRGILKVTLSHDLEQLVLKAVQERHPINAEVVLRYPDERVGLAKAWTDPNSEDRVFLSIYEITNLRRLERVRRDFVANVSHELRTPMTTIRAMAEILSDSDPEEMQTLGPRYLGRIISEIDRLTLISDDLLTLASAEANPVAKSATNVVEIVRNVVDQLRSQAEAKELSLILTSPDVVIAPVNANQFTQVVFNLAANAINYTNKGSVTVRVDETPDEVVLSISDTGIGIPLEDQPRIFERFYRVDKGRSRASGGTGLGLSIVKHIIESHGGRVTVESELNKGSTFLVSLPKR